MPSPRSTFYLLIAIACGNYRALAQAAPTTGPTPSATPKSATNIAQEEQSDAEIILLAGLPLAQPKESILSYTRQTYIKTDLIKDKAIQQMVRMALSKIEDQPEKAGEIRQGHLNLLSDLFLNQAMEAQKQNRFADLLKLIQISVRCNPANAKSKLFYANFLHSNMGRTDDAIQTLRHGLEFLNADDTLGRDYLERYFQLLQLRERDAEVIEQSLKLLQFGKTLPQPTREIISLAAATSLYWTGKYPEAVNIINSSNLDSRAPGLLLKAKALFDGGKYQDAIALLESKCSSYKGAAHDAILSQQARFHILLGQSKVALSVTNDRVASDEKAPFPHIQKLQLLDRIGLKDDYDKELRLISENFANNSAAMIALANFAAEKGYDGLTLAVANVAQSQGFDRATFAALHLEALLNAKQPEQVILQYQQVTTAERTFFKSNEPLVQALLGIAYHARTKKDALTAKVDRDIGDRYLTEFLKSKDLGPEAFRSVGRHLRAIRATDAAVRILEAGIAAHPKHSQLRSDYIRARILAGQTDSYGTRKSVVEELELLLTQRRPSPLIWQDAISWLQTESKLPADKARQLQSLMAPLVRSNLDPEALAGR
ncbi:MAG: hypothetical protein EBU04_01520 [Verrucomicrobia bacterium]|nr:hypothetical protein [Verrucomicrobiota bacterium]NBY36446.1 hypothetical protein [Verrucomicrobiota bacterium]